MTRTRAYLRTNIEAPGTVADHEAATDPHSQYATDADLEAHVAADDPHPNYVIGSGTHTITVGPTPPTNPQVGDLWIDTSP